MRFLSFAAFGFLVISATVTAAQHICWIDHVQQKADGLISDKAG
jgi:hypothetical protein